MAHYFQAFAVMGSKLSSDPLCLGKLDVLLVIEITFKFFLNANNGKSLFKLE